MQNFLKYSILSVFLILLGCDKSVNANDAESIKSGPSGDEGIQREIEIDGTNPIQINPEKINPEQPSGDIIIPPPTVNMPAEIVPNEPAE